MAEPDWLAYTGAIAGVVGAVTGIVGAVMGYIAYRYSKELKALDLRLELRKAVAELAHEVSELPDLLNQANKSRNAVAAATSGRGSGAPQRWAKALESDVEALRTLQGHLPDPTADYDNKTPRELEALLVHTHALQTRATRLREKYTSELDADEKTRERIHADVRARTQTRPEGRS